MSDKSGVDPSGSRRRFLAGLAGLASTPLLRVPGSSAANGEPRLVEARLVAGVARAQLTPSGYEKAKLSCMLAALLR